MTITAQSTVFIPACNSSIADTCRSRWHRWSQGRVNGNPGTISKALATAW